MKSNTNTQKPIPHKPIPSRGIGLKGIEDADPRIAITKEVAGKGAELGVWLIKWTVIGVVGLIIYNKFTHRFIKLKPNPKFPIANVSDAISKTRADAIVNSMPLFDFTGNSFDVTSQALAGLNYNGFIAVYNAFGKHSGHFGGGDLNLIEWIFDQFSDTEIRQLSSLQNGVFF